MPKRILVTGGAGFLGSHLCKELISRGNEVVCIDNYYTGNKNNIIELIDNVNFELIEYDITKPLNEVSHGLQAVRLFRVEEIYNLACPASPIHYQRDPIQTLKTCVYGTMNILEFANRINAKVFQASTSEIYGDPKIHPQIESYWGNVNPIGIRSCYDEGKRCAETLLFDYQRQHKLKIKVVRIFNTYGTHMNKNDGRVISNFIVQALNNKDITIYGNGTQTRSFCYVDDLIDGFIKVMESPDDFFGPVNLGNPVEYSILDIAKKIISLTQSQSKIIFKSLPQDDPKQRQPDISLAKEKLKWQPHIQLEEGLLHTIQYFKGIRVQNGKET